MSVISNLTVADIMGGLLLAALIVALFLLTRWTGYGSRPLLLKRMIERAGGKLDVAGDPLLGERLASAARLCASCRNYEECRKLLSQDSGSDVPDYCPNRHWIRTLPAGSS